VEPLLQRCMDVVVDVLAQAHFLPVRFSTILAWLLRLFLFLFWLAPEGVCMVWNYTVASALNPVCRMCKMMHFYLCAVDWRCAICLT
jgi:hypothetical protein